MDGRLTPYHRRDQAYDAAVSEACHRTDTPPETPENAVMGVTTSAIATDVLSLFDAETGTASTAGSGAAARRTFGANMRLILVFETADAPPVADLIDLDQGILVDSYSTDDHQPVHHPLVSIADLAGEARPYLLVPSGKPSQSDREITLPWDFGFSDLRADEPFHLPYKAGFDYFRVTRTNLSRPDDKPKVVNLTPCWLDRGPRTALAGEPQFVRPKFQFVDKDFPADGIGAVREGDKLQYLVEAFGEINPAKPLAKCLFEIDRQTFEALSAPGPLLALHAAEAVERPTGSGRYLLGGNVELAVGVARESDLANLKLRYRLRSIRAIGPYGAETDPGVATRPRAGLPDHARVLPASTPPRPGSPPPAPHLIPDVRFSESPLSRGIPWEETTGLELRGLTWQELRVPRDPAEPGEAANATARSWTAAPLAQPLDHLGYRTLVPLSALVAAVEEQRGAGVPAGHAIEIWAGLEVLPSSPDQPLRRSALVMARHALLTTALEEPELNDDGAMIVARDFFGRGNPVDAIETPAPRTALQRRATLPRTRPDHPAGRLRLPAAGASRGGGDRDAEDQPGGDRRDRRGDPAGLANAGRAGCGPGRVGGEHRRGRRPRSNRGLSRAPDRSL